MNIGWGLAVMLGAFASAGVSGAHLNPAVSLAFAAFRDFPWRKVVPYAMAQLLGAFLASAVVYLTYREALDAFDGGLRAVSGPTATAGIWATYPQPYLSIAGGFVDQVVGTALLLMGLFALVDAKNANLPHYVVPVAAGALVLTIGATFGMNSGYAINPARDFGPRLFTADRGLGRRRLPGRQRVVVGAARRHAGGRADRRVSLRPLHHAAPPGGRASRRPDLRHAWQIRG